MYICIYVYMYICVYVYTYIQNLINNMKFNVTKHVLGSNIYPALSRPLINAESVYLSCRSFVNHSEKSETPIQ